MKIEKRSKLLLLVPALWASVVDICLTIIYQPTDYWNGNLSKANEANPIGGFLMHNHVSGIFFISGLWLLIIGFLGFYLPKRVSRYFLVFVLVSHSIAASSWIFPRFGFWAFLILAIINSSIFVFIDERVNKLKGVE